VSAPTRPVLRYHGGKWRLAPWIISHFPPHRIYTEAFGGAGSVLLRKPRAPFVEVLNDLDGEVVNLFRVLRDEQQSAQLCALLWRTPYARAEFVDSYEVIAAPVEQARRTVVRSFMGFGSDSASGAVTGFRRATGAITRSRFSSRASGCVASSSNAAPAPTSSGNTMPRARFTTWIRLMPA
jgi:DNA adenine methylase